MIDQAQGYPCPASHIHKRETLGDKPRLAAIRAIAYQDLSDAVEKYNRIDDMHDDAVAELRRYRSPGYRSRMPEREKSLRLARSIRKLTAARDGLPCAIEKMDEAAKHVLAVESEIAALGASS